MNKPAFRISIPKPCHEDWNKMTPDEKGAFCASCQKSVYDFTGKTDEEIALFVAQNTGKKICGRFNADQVERPIEFNVPVYDLPSGISPFKAFALALFLVFGSMLFNCQTVSGQVMGKMKLIETPAPNSDDREKKQDKTTTDDKIKEPLKVMGGPKFIPHTQTNDSTATKQMPVDKKRPKMMGDVQVCELPLKGEMVVTQVPPTADTAKKKEPVPPVKTDSIEPLMGKMAVMQVKKPDEKKMDVIKKMPGMKITDEPVQQKKANTPAVNPSDAVMKTGKPEGKTISVEVMPNPSSGKLTLRYAISEKNMTSLELYDLSGTKVKTLMGAQQLYEGTYNTVYDISDLPEGIYICLLNSGSGSAGAKVILAK